MISGSLLTDTATVIAPELSLEFVGTTGQWFMALFAGAGVNTSMSASIGHLPASTNVLTTDNVLGAAGTASGGPPPTIED
jgi:hypothetical protein